MKFKTKTTSNNLTGGFSSSSKLRGKVSPPITSSILPTSSTSSILNEVDNNIVDKADANISYANLTLNNIVENTENKTAITLAAEEELNNTKVNVIKYLTNTLSKKNINNKDNVSLLSLLSTVDDILNKIDSISNKL